MGRSVARNVDVGQTVAHRYKHRQFFTIAQDLTKMLVYARRPSLTSATSRWEAGDVKWRLSERNFSRSGEPGAHECDHGCKMWSRTTRSWSSPIRPEIISGMTAYVTIRWPRFRMFENSPTRRCVLYQTPMSPEENSRVVQQYGIEPGEGKRRATKPRRPERGGPSGGEAQNPPRAPRSDSAVYGDFAPTTAWSR